MNTTLQENPPLSPLHQRPRHVHTITDRFSAANTYLIDDGRLIVVDPGSVMHVYLLLRYLQSFLHYSPDDIDLIVLTHLHPDHTAGVETLRRVCQAPVAASVIARHLVQMWQGEEPLIEQTKSASTRNLLEQLVNQRTATGTIHHTDLFTSHYERQAKMIDLWLEDVVGLPNHPDWRVIASPGQTPESICLYNPFSYELLSSDTLVTIEGTVNLVRGGTNRHHLEETLKTLRNLQIYYLYPGHGRPILAYHALKHVLIAP